MPKANNNSTSSDERAHHHHHHDVTDNTDPLSEPLLPPGPSPPLPTPSSSATGTAANNAKKSPMMTFQDDVLEDEQKRGSSSLLMPSVPPPSAFTSMRDICAEMDDDDDLHGEETPWPDLARTARFLFDPAGANGPILGVAEAARAAAETAASAHHGTNTNGVEDRSVCRLSYCEEKKRIEVLDCTPDNYGVCLTSFDPADVVGAELQIHLHAPDRADLGDDDDDDDDGGGRDDGDGDGQEFFDASSGAGTQDDGDVDGEGEVAHDKGGGETQQARGARGQRGGRSRRRGDAGSRAFLNVWHYPRVPRRDSGWCRISSLFSSKADAEAAPAPAPAAARAPSPGGEGEGAAENSSGLQGAAADEEREEEGEEPLGRHPRHLVFELVTCEDLADARCCVRSIRRLARLHPGARQRRCLVVLNPYSGIGGAMDVYESTVRIMLDQSGVEHDLFVTERGGHATERMLDRRGRGGRPPPRVGVGVGVGGLGVGGTSNGGSEGERGEEAKPLVVVEGEEYGDAREGDHDDHHRRHLADDRHDPGDQDRDLTEYDAVVAMGGDGILFEVMQGVRRRDDSEYVLDRITFGVVGCGTSNGMAKSILHEGGEKYGALESTFQICRGATSQVDLSVYETMTTAEEDKDGANDGERGPAASASATTATATNARSYYGFLTFAYGLIADVDLESECIHFLGSIRNDIWAVWRILTMRTYRCRFTYLPPPSAPAKAEASAPSTSSSPAGAAVLPPLSEPIPVGGSSGGGSGCTGPAWEVVEGDVICFWACQVSHAAFNMHNSPRSRLNDGLFRVLIVRTPCSRLKLIRMFLQMETGDHVGIDGLEMIDCVAFRLEPLGGGRRSYNDLDGEEIEAGPVQGWVLPSAARFFTS